MATAGPGGPPASPSCSRDGTPCPPPVPTPFFGQAGEAEGEVLKWEKEEKEEEEEEAAPAPAEASMRERALNSSTGLQSLRRRARGRGRVEVKEELHPLQSRWALWFFKNDRSRAWRDNLHQITKFDTVEDFWALYNHIKLASKLSAGCDYALFKDGIEPTWEDARNRRGGRWLISLSKQRRHIELDRLWLETLLCLIGESFEEFGRDVCGAVVSVRDKGDKIAVWTREAENQTAVLHIGQVYKERLGLSTKTIIGYQAHADTATKSNTLAKNKNLAKNRGTCLCSGIPKNQPKNG